MSTAASPAHAGFRTIERSRLDQIAELLDCEAELFEHDGATHDLASIAQLLTDWSAIHDPAGRRQVIDLARKLASM